MFHVDVTNVTNLSQCRCAAWQQQQINQFFLTSNADATTLRPNYIQNEALPTETLSFTPTPPALHNAQYSNRRSTRVWQTWCPLFHLRLVRRKLATFCLGSRVPTCATPRSPHQPLGCPQVSPPNGGPKTSWTWTPGLPVAIRCHGRVPRINLLLLIAFFSYVS